MNSLDLANKLNKSIISSKEYKELKEAEDKVFSNTRSKNIFMSFIEKQKELQDITKSKIADDEINRIRLELMDIYDRVETNDNLCLLIDALDRFIQFKDKIMKTIDADIGLSSEIYMLRNNRSCNKKCGGCK